MNSKDAKDFLLEIRDQNERKWKDPKHIATDTLRPGIIKKLSRDRNLQEDYSIALVEVFLSESVPQIDHFDGIIEVDDLGIWYYDGDGDISEPVWRQYLLPWRAILAVTLHQSS